MLKLENIVKIFNMGTINEKKALQGVSITIEDGDFITVIGGNGAGKSTMLNLIAGVFPPEEGKIYLDDKAVTALSEYKRAKCLGRGFQDPTTGAAANMQRQETLAVAYRRGKIRRLKGAVSKQEKAMFKEQLALLGLGLEDRMTTKVGLLSGGQRQALTLLMATFNRPELLLLDEHTAALDPKTAEKVLKVTEELTARDNLTTLMVTHNMKDAIRLGNRLIMMHAGRIIYDVRGEEKSKLTVADLLAKFDEVSDGDFANDRMLLAK